MISHDTLEAIGHFLTGVGVLIAGLAWRLNAANNRASILISRKALLLQANSIALANDDSLRASVRVQFPHLIDKLEEARDTFITFNLLNCAEVAWITTKLKLDAHNASEVSYLNFLNLLLADRSKWPLLVDGGYSENFIKHCCTLSSEFEQFYKASKSKIPAR